MNLMHQICPLVFGIFILRGDFMVSVVIGGYRNFEKYEIFKSFVDSCLAELDPLETTILSGHCKGVDLLGERYAKEKDLALELYPAEWKKYGKAAGPIRNKQCQVTDRY